MSVNIKEKLAEELSTALNIPRLRLVPLIETPPDPAFGDFAVPCFSFAKELKKPPAQIAEEFDKLCHANEERTKSIRSTQPRGPYLNMFMNRGSVVRDIVEDVFFREFSSARRLGTGKIVVIDYSSPNIAKPFGIGHLRSTVIGNALRKIFSYLGYKVIGINHLGDWGTQFGKLITAFRKWGEEQALKSDPIHHLFSLYVKFHAEAEKDPSLDDEARIWFQKLEQKDPEAVSLWTRFRDLSLSDFSRIYERLGVSFDFHTGESFYDDMISETIERVKACGIIEESEGALIVPLGDEMPPALLKKRDDTTLYLTRDISAALYRYEKFRFDLALYVVGSPQTLHFNQVFGVLHLMQVAFAENCHHVPFGQIRFEDGAMSTRKGNVIFLEDVLDKAVDLARRIIEEKNPALGDKQEVAEAVGVGAVVFNDLKNSRIRDITFNWDDVLNFDGETGPYVQYTYARAGSLLKKFTETYGSHEFEEELHFGEEGYAVCVMLNKFEDTVVRASKEFEPSLISRLLLDISSQFNTFYNTHRVITEHRDLSLSRALVAKCVQKVLRQGMELIGVVPVEEM
jgi:arginyl-tRNA synthetase